MSDKSNTYAPGGASSVLPHTPFPFRMPGHALNVAEARQKIAELIAVLLPHVDPRSAHIARCIAHQVDVKLLAVEESLSGERGAPWPLDADLARAAKALLSLRLVEDAPQAPMSVHDPAEDLEVIP